MLVRKVVSCPNEDLVPYRSIALVVSAERQVRQLIVVSLAELGCSTIEAATHEEGLEYAALTYVDVVVVDVGQLDAFESAMICELRRNQPALKVLYLVGRMNPVFRSSLEPKAHDFYLRKPFRLHELCDIVSSWLEDGKAFLTVTGISLN